MTIFTARDGRPATRGALLLASLLLASLVAIGGTGCQTGNDEPRVIEVGARGEAPTTPPRRRVIGTVETVYPSQGFILVRRSTDLIPVEGSRLIAEGGGAPSQLLASSHRQGTFFSAEIEDGIPRPGDEVRFLVHADKEKLSETLTLPDRDEWARRAAAGASTPVDGAPTAAPAPAPPGLGALNEPVGKPAAGFVSMADDGGRMGAAEDAAADGEFSLEDLGAIERGPLGAAPVAVIGTEAPSGPVRRAEPPRPPDPYAPLPPAAPTGVNAEDFPEVPGLPPLLPPPSAR